MTMMKKMMALSFLLSLSVFAGKEDREYKKNELDPAVKAMQEAYKAASGCEIKVEFEGKEFELKDHMAQVKFMMENIKDSVGTYCKDSTTQKPDADSQKAVCKMKTLKVKMGADAAFEFKDSTGIATMGTSGGYAGFDMMMTKIDL